MVKQLSIKINNKQVSGVDVPFYVHSNFSFVLENTIMSHFSLAFMNFTYESDTFVLQCKTVHVIMAQSISKKIASYCVNIVD